MSEPEPITINPMASVFNYIADLERQLAEVIKSYEAMRHSWAEEHDALLEAQGKIEAVREAAELGPAVPVATIFRIIKGE